MRKVVRILKGSYSIDSYYIGGVLCMMLLAVKFLMEK